MLDKPELCYSVIPRMWHKTSTTVKLAFLSSFLGGLLVYLFALTNIIICTGDALTNTVFDGNLVWLGRWSSAWLSGLGTDASMPLVNGLLMITAVSLLSALVVAYLRIKTGICAILCGLTLICFPSVGDTLKYIHNADGYMIAAMLAALSLLILDRYRFGWLISAPLLAVAVGTYQANAALVVSLMFVRAVGLIVQGERSNKELVLLALRYILYFAASLALYYVLVGVFVRASGFALSDYQSVSDMGNVSLPVMWSNFIGCYADFKQQITFLSFRPEYYVNGYANYLFAALSVGLTLLVFALGRNKTWLKGIALVALLLLSPMLLCCIRIFNPANVYSLMTYSVAGMYLLGLSMLEVLPSTLERLSEPDVLKRVRPLAKRTLRALCAMSSWVVTACLIICLFVWSVGVNLDFYRGKMDYENMYAQCTDYLSIAESTEGYEPGTPIYVVGSIGGSGSARGAVRLQEPKYFYAFMVHYLSVRMPYEIANAINDEAAKRAADEVFADMPAYPNAGCAKLIDGAVVLKLSD